MVKIVHYGFLFVYENFHGQISIKTKNLSILLKSNICYKLLQIKNVFQSTIELFKCASILQHNESMKCYPLLIAHFNNKIFSKYFGTPHTKCDIVKIVKLWKFLCTLYHGNTQRMNLVLTNLLIHYFLIFPFHNEPFVYEFHSWNIFYLDCRWFALAIRW